jgi:hypothetical protein
MSTASKAAKGTDVTMASPELEEAGASKPIQLKRRLNVRIEGTPNLFEQLGPQSATWAPAENMHGKMFGAHMDCEAMDAPDHAAVLSSISNAVIVKATMLESKSTFPMPLGLSCNCIPGSEHTEFGERFLTTILPQGTQTEAQTLYEADQKAQLGMQWRTHYPQYTKANLETEGTMQVANCGYIFVSQHHPVIELIKENGMLVDSDLESQPLIDGEWLKLTKQLFAQACTALRTDILGKIQSADLNTLQFQLHTFNHAPWTSMRNEEFCYTHATNDEEKAALVAARLNHPCSFHARVELVYELNR